jgi:replicative DNA helicase
MIEKQMIRLMLNKKFYTQYKGTLSPTVFAGDISSLYDTIQKAHEKYEEDIKVDELYSLHTAIFNPALTRAAKEKFSELVEDIKEVQEPSKEIAKDIMRILSDRDLAQRIAVESTEIFNGKEANFNEIVTMIEKHKRGIDEDKVPAVTHDINDVLTSLATTSRWKFNIPILKDNIGGVGAGNLMIAFARPETGKTAFWVSLCAGPNGFAEQGAKIHAFINEEPAVRTQMRAISCYTGMTREEVIGDLDTAQSYWDEIKDNISMFDTVDWSMDDIDAHCNKRDCKEKRLCSDCHISSIC